MNGPQYREGSSFTEYRLIGRRMKNRIPHGWMIPQYVPHIKIKITEIKPLEKSSIPQYRKPPCPPP